MSKKWPPEPLQLQQDNIASTKDTPSSSTFLQAPPPIRDRSSHRESNTSDAQYAIAGLSSQYIDLPSAVPFQSTAGIITPALPSADFPSSVRGYVSTPPASSSTAEFPTPPRTESVNSYYYGAYSPETGSRASIASSEHTIAPRNSTTGATGLNRADSNVSYNSVWTGDGSEQHFRLDITQFPQPPDAPPESSVDSTPTIITSSFGSHRRLHPLLVQPPHSPLYEESEPPQSRPITPATAKSNDHLDARSEHSAPPSPIGHSADHYPVPMNQFETVKINPAETLKLPSIGLASSHDSYHSIATMASKGSSVAHLSVDGASQRASALTESGAAWETVMNTVKAGWAPNANGTNPQPGFSSPAPSSTSAQAVVGGNTTESAGEKHTSTRTNPNGLLSAALSGESTSDIYSALGRMSFPRPPGTTHSERNSAVSPDHSSSPLSQGTPRSPWITGLTLKTKTQSRNNSLRRRADDSPGTPRTPHTPRTPVPPLPSPGGGLTVPTSIVVSAPVSQPTTPANRDGGESFWGSSDKDSHLDLPAESRLSSTSGNAPSQAPSYDRRLEELVRATTEPPPRISLESAASTASDLARMSVDGAVVGVARAASLSWRSNALVTRGPSLNDRQRLETGYEKSHPYLIPSPIQPAQHVEYPHAASIPSPGYAISETYENYSAPPSASLHPFALQHSSSLRRPSTREHTMFPESVGSDHGRSYEDTLEGYSSLGRYSSRDGPPSAVPLNPLNRKPSLLTKPPSAYKAPPSAGSSAPGDRPSKPKSRRNSAASSTLERVSSVVSRMSNSRAVKAFSWFRRKPLPPLPNSPEYEKRREKALPNPDDGMTIPDLAGRVAAMNQYLDVGELPYVTPLHSPAGEGQGYMHEQAVVRAKSIRSVLTSISDRSGNGPVRGGPTGFTRLAEKTRNTGYRRSMTPSSWLASRRWKIIAFFVVWILVAIAITLGVIFGKRAQQGQSVPSTCAGVLTGDLCELNSTCVCTSTIPGRCDPVAQSLVDLIPRTNSLFSLNLSANALALTLWDLKGETMGNCASQAVLVDVGPGLSSASSPNRTEWSQSAILYNLVRTEDLESTESLRAFVAGSYFRGLRGDGPVTDDASRISFQASGFVYDFAAMSFSPSAISWKENSQAEPDQIARVGFVSDRALDRLYSFSTASSTQRSTALMRYWTTVLQLPAERLASFLSALRNAPVLLPFDANSDVLSSFIESSVENDGISFPPPITCIPGVSEDIRGNVGVIEQTAFGLAGLDSAPAELDSACFPDRPVYGVLDVLRLRRSFPDSRGDVRLQASQLIQQAGPRVVVHNGEQLVGSSDAVQNNIVLTSAEMDPRYYGTLQHLNHIALTYLKSFPSIELAGLAAQFILDSNENSDPPSQGTQLFDETDSLRNVPTLQVAIFGTILPSDVNVYHSNIAKSNGSLYLGSADAETFRSWALRESVDVIIWSNSSSAARTVQETPGNAEFETVCDEATELINDAAEVGRGTGFPELLAIMGAFEEAGLLT